MMVIEGENYSSSQAWFEIVLVQVGCPVYLGVCCSIVVPHVQKIDSFFVNI